MLSFSRVDTSDSSDLWLYVMYVTELWADFSQLNLEFICETELQCYEQGSAWEERNAGCVWNCH